MEFEEYVAAAEQWLLRYTYVLTGDPHAAEDLAQTTLLTAYRKWARVSAAANTDAYVRRIATNAYIDSTRKRSFHERPADDYVSGTQDHHDPTRQVDDRADLADALETLGPRAYAILVLRYYVDLDDTAIADALGIAPSTVRATASRALAQLRATHTRANPLRRTS